VCWLSFISIVKGGGAGAHSKKETNGSNNIVFSVSLYNNIKDGTLSYCQPKNPRACNIWFSDAGCILAPDPVFQARRQTVCFHGLDVRRGPRYTLWELYTHTHTHGVILVDILQTVRPAWSQISLQDTAAFRTIFRNTYSIQSLPSWHQGNNLLCQNFSSCTVLSIVFTVSLNFIKF
jgi:hypothetical protein